MTESDKPRKPPGRKKQYETERDGAPLLQTRINPDKLAWVKTRPEGTRPYLERIIGEDKEKVLAAESVVDGVKRSDTGPEAADT